MRLPDQQKLLNALLTRDELEDLRRTSAIRGLAAVRKIRRRRLVVRASLVIIVSGVLTYSVARWHSGPEPPASVLTVHSPSPTQETTKSTGIEVISDDELFALFPDRGVALIGRPGSQKLLVFDKQSL